MRRISKNSKETATLAKTFFDQILKNKNKHPGALVVALSGDLGSGKTAFTQGVAKYVGIKDKISSPTFVIIKKYALALQRRSIQKRQKYDFRFLFHLDAYRLKNERELMHLGWDEIINNKEHLVFIEWPENVAKVLPSRTRFIYLSINKNGFRNLELR